LKSVSRHLPEIWRHFVFPKRFLCFRVRIRVRVKVRVEVRVRVSRNTFKYVFGQTSNCTRSVEIKYILLVKAWLYQAEA